MRFGSLFSGIGGFDLGFERAGATCTWQVEIDPKCQAVLRRQLPGAEIYDDVTKVGRHNLKPVDLVCGGFPCQDLSVAGKRAGLAGERSGLWFEFHRILAELKPGWVVIENVPGLLSSNGGRDFAVILRGLVELGYGVAWRILDAQHFGVSQRRRRVFIVGHLGDGRAAQVLFERESSGGDTPPSREAGKGIAHAISASPTATGRLDPNGQDSITNAFNGYTGGADDNDAQGNHIVVARQTGNGYWNSDGLGGLRANPGGIAENLIAFNIQHNDGGNHKRKDRPNGGMYVNETDTALTVGSTDMTAIATWDPRNVTSKANRTRVEAGLPANTLHKDGLSIIGMGVRRLTPVECERLQGFPDGWTGEQSDSTRYRQLGNAVCVPVVEWIGKRILEQMERR